MEGTTFVVLLVAMGCLTSLVKTWINHSKEDNQIDKKTFNKLAQAFIQHKKDMQERVENLEAIIAEHNDKEFDKSHFSELEEKQDEGTLSNDLQQKRRVK